MLKRQENAKLSEKLSRIQHEKRAIDPSLYAIVEQKIRELRNECSVLRSVVSISNVRNHTSLTMQRTHFNLLANCVTLAQKQEENPIIDELKNQLQETKDALEQKILENETIRKNVEQYEKTIQDQTIAISQSQEKLIRTLHFEKIAQQAQQEIELLKAKVQEQSKIVQVTNEQVDELVRQKLDLERMVESNDSLERQNAFEMLREQEQEILKWKTKSQVLENAIQTGTSKQIEVERQDFQTKEQLWANEIVKLKTTCETLEQLHKNAETSLAELKAQNQQLSMNNNILRIEFEQAKQKEESIKQECEKIKHENDQYRVLMNDRDLDFKNLQETLAGMDIELKENVEQLLTQEELLAEKEEQIRVLKEGTNGKRILELETHVNIIEERLKQSTTRCVELESELAIAQTALAQKLNIGQLNAENDILVEKMSIEFDQVKKQNQKLESSMENMLHDLETVSNDLRRERESKTRLQFEIDQLESDIRGYEDDEYDDEELIDKIKRIRGDVKRIVSGTVSELYDDEENGKLVEEMKQLEDENRAVTQKMKQVEQEKEQLLEKRELVEKQLEKSKELQLELEQTVQRLQSENSKLLEQSRARENILREKKLLLAQSEVFASDLSSLKSTLRTARDEFVSLRQIQDKYNEYHQASEKTKLEFQLVHQQQRETIDLLRNRSNKLDVMISLIRERKDEIGTSAESTIGQVLNELLTLSNDDELEMLKSESNRLSRRSMQLGQDLTELMKNADKNSKRFSVGETEDSVSEFSAESGDSTQRRAKAKTRTPVRGARDAILARKPSKNLLTEPTVQ
jgi:chromosome segregation ATPase